MVGRVAISTGARILAPGQSVTLTATVTSIEGRSLTDRPVLWTLSHPSLASITKAGLTATLRAESTGDVQVTASVEGQSATLNFTIAPASSASNPNP